MGRRYGLIYLADYAMVLIVGDKLATGASGEIDSFQHLLGTRIPGSNTTGCSLS
jgi:hypothetical protein